MGTFWIWQGDDEEGLRVGVLFSVTNKQKTINGNNVINAEFAFAAPAAMAA